jgi:hypothetical protein
MTGKKPNALEALVLQAAELSENSNLRQVAYDLARGLDDGMLRRLAVQYIVDKVRDHGRHVTLMAERRAMREQLLHELSRPGRPAPPAGRQWRRTPEQEAEIAAQDAAIQARYVRTLTDVMHRYTEEMRLEWTQELLDSTFVGADGELITWGDASADDHRARVEMFMRNAEANMEGAARHTKALHALEATGAATLRGLVAAA